MIVAIFLWYFAGPSNGVCHTVGNKPCQFPFRYNGVSYSSCTLEDADDETKPWCSTLVDNDGNHVSGGGHYGDCGPKCPLSGRSTLKWKTWLICCQKTVGFFSSVSTILLLWNVNIPIDFLTDRTTLNFICIWHRL